MGKKDKKEKKKDKKEKKGKVAKNPIGWTEDEKLLAKYPMLRSIAHDVLNTFKAKGIDPASLASAEVEGQSESPFDMFGRCNGTTGSLYNAPE